MYFTVVYGYSECKNNEFFYKKVFSVVNFFAFAFSFADIKEEILGFSCPFRYF